MQYFVFAVSKFSRGWHPRTLVAGGATPSRTLPQHGAGLRRRCCDPHGHTSPRGLYPPCLLSFWDLPPPLIHVTAGWLPRTGISSGTLRSVIEYPLGLVLTKNCNRLISKKLTSINRLISYNFVVNQKAIKTAEFEYLLSFIQNRKRVNDAVHH